MVLWCYTSYLEKASGKVGGPGLTTLLAAGPQGDSGQPPS
jgi:hypothetical protein